VGGDAEIGAPVNGVLSLFSNGLSALSFTGALAATFASSVTTSGAKPQLYVSGNSSNGSGIHLTTSLSGANRRNWGIFTEEVVDGDFVIKCSTAAGGSPGSGNTRLQILNSGTVQPGGNGTQDLGSATNRWSTVYTSDLSLNNGIGDWTIVEGEDDLFLYNNKKGKVYKFALTEVDPNVATPKKS
jgi:hypothetical protein